MMKVSVMDFHILFVLLVLVVCWEEETFITESCTYAGFMLIRLDPKLIRLEPDQYIGGSLKRKS